MPLGKFVADDLQFIVDLLARSLVRADVIAASVSHPSHPTYARSQLSCAGTRFPVSPSVRQNEPTILRRTDHHCRQLRLSYVFGPSLTGPRKAGRSGESRFGRSQGRQPIKFCEQIAQCAAPIGVEPAPTPMLGSVVHHVASLAERGEVAGAVVAGIVVQMRARDIHPRGANDRRDIAIRYADATSPPVPPMPVIGVPPATVSEVEDARAMRTPAMLAPALGAAEPDQPRQLGPIDWVEPAMFRHDRHRRILNQRRRERKQKIACSIRWLRGSRSHARLSRSRHP